MKQLSNEQRARVVARICGGSVSPPRKRKVADVTVRIWTAEDIERLRKYKEGNYRKGRGRKPQKKSGNR